MILAGPKGTLGVLIALSFICIAAFSALLATSFVMMSDEDLADQAGFIAWVEVSGRRAPSQTGRLETLYTARVIRWLKNSERSPSITFAVPGGIRPDGSGLRIDAAPVFAPGEQAILFLERRSDGSYGILQLMLGAFHRHDFEGSPLALRDLAGAAAFRRSGDRANDPDPAVRGFREFAEWLADRSQGKRADKNYFLDVDIDQARLSFRYVLSKSSSNHPIRWFDFDSGGNISWRAHEDGQSGMTGGGFAEFQQAQGAWNAVAGADVDYRYAGTTTSTAEFNGTDGVNAILFDDPNDSISGSFNCSSGGTLAIGGTYYTGSTQAYGGDVYHRSVEGEVVTQDNAGCFFDGHGGADGAEVFTHELGHTLGLAHSSVPGAVMRSSAYGDGRGASLGDDDRDGILFLYSSSGPPPPQDQADLSVSISDSPDPVAAGAMLTYTVTVSNAGPDTAQSVSLTSSLSSKVSFSSSNPSCTGGSTRTCALGSLNSGQSVQVTIVVTVNGNATGSIGNSSSVSSSTSDPTPGNNSDSESTSIAASGADLQVTVSDSPDPVLPGGELTYTVRVANNGPDSSTGSDLEMNLPPQVSLNSVSPSGCTPNGNTLNCAVGGLSAGSFVTYTVRTQVGQQVLGSIGFSASVQGNQSDPSTSNNSRSASTLVAPKADLSLSKSDLADPVGIGQQIPYRLSVTNLGPSSAADVVVNDNLPAGVEFVSAPSGCSLLGNRVRCSLGSLAADQSRSLDITVRAVAEGDVLNSASVTSATSDPNPLNNSDSEQTQVKGDSDLDGVPDTAENGAPHSGDGNQDGVADSQQQNVASLPSVRGGYLTVEAPQGVELDSVSAQEPPALPSELAGIGLPSGLLRFNAGNLSNGQAVSITLLMHAATAQLNSYYKFGPTPQNPSPHWYEFLYDGKTGAELLGDRVRLHFVDGQRGDGDLSANGVISDPGGPAVDLRSDLEVSQSVSTSAVNSGQSVAYLLDVANKGPAAVQGVRLRLPLPPRAEFLQALPGQGSCGMEGEVLECSLGNLAKQGGTDVEVMLRLHQSGLNTAQADVLSGQPDPEQSNNHASAQVSVMPSVLAPVSLASASSLFEDGFVGMAVYNPSSGPNSVLLEGFSPSGDSLASSEEAGLDGGGQMAFTTVEAFPDPQVQTIEARGGDFPVQGFFMVGDNVSQRLDGIGAPLVESTDLHFLTAGNGPGSSTVLYLYNPGPQSAAQAEITLYGFGATAQVVAQTGLSLAGNGTLAASLQDIFGLPGEAPQGWLSVTSDRPLRGFQMVADDDTYMSMVGRLPETAQRLTAPHFFLDGSGGSSRLRLLNRGLTEVRARIRALNDQSGLIAQTEVILEPNELLSEDLGALLGLEALPGETLTGFLRIDLSEPSVFVPRPVSVTGAIEFGGPGYRSMLPLIAQGRTESLFLHVAQSPDFHFFTGFAVVNDNQTTAQLTLRAYDRNGQLTAETAFALAAGRRVVDLLNSPVFFGPGFEQVGGHLEVLSDQPLLAFTLFGDDRLRFLSAIEGQ